jgi:hypothetical protein
MEGQGCGVKRQGGQAPPVAGCQSVRKRGPDSDTVGAAHRRDRAHASSGLHRRGADHGHIAGSVAGLRIQSLDDGSVGLTVSPAQDGALRRAAVGVAAVPVGGGGLKGKWVWFVVGSVLLPSPSPEVWPQFPI